MDIESEDRVGGREVGSVRTERVEIKWEEGKHGECGQREWRQSGRRGSRESTDRKSGDRVAGEEVGKVRTNRVETEWEG